MALDDYWIVENEEYNGRKNVEDERAYLDVNVIHNHPIMGLDGNDPPPSKRQRT